MREPYADRFRLILNDLGAGFAARGDDLEEIVERSNPALRQTDRVLKILAQQNRTLATLARDSDTVLGPLARERENIVGFIEGANETAQATAERAGDLEAGLARFPGYLHELRLTMVELRRFADQGTPVISDLGDAAPSLTRAQRALGPLADAATPALRTLGAAAEQSQADIVASDPVIRAVRNLARAARPGAKQLNKLLRSLRNTDGIQALTDFIFNTSTAANGFDSFGHYLRTFGLITNCTRIINVPVGGCSALFEETSTEAAAAALEPRGNVAGERPPRPQHDRGTLNRPDQRAQPTPEQSEPLPSHPLEPQGRESQGLLTPAPQAEAGSRSTRGGKALFRFLLEDGP
jgi:phospholipid/cholesterol/gamma-HCH transport system substrate-binding protein